MIRPSFKSGYALHAAESVAPDLWEGLRNAWVPSLGHTGTRIRDVLGYADAVLTGSKQYTPRGINLDGSVDYASFGGGVIDDTAAFTISADLKTANSSGYRGILSTRGSAGSQGIIFRLHTGTAVPYFYLYDGAFKVVNGPSGLNDNRLHRVTCTYDGIDKLEMYVDGRSVDTATIGTVTAGDDGWIGRDSANLFIGELDYILHYDRALNACEVRKLNQLGSAGLFAIAPRVPTIVPTAPTGTFPYQYYYQGQS